MPKPSIPDKTSFENLKAYKAYSVLIDNISDLLMKRRAGILDTPSDLPNFKNSLRRMARSIIRSTYKCMYWSQVWLLDAAIEAQLIKVDYSTTERVIRDRLIDKGVSFQEASELAGGVFESSKDEGQS